jgi:hypothetical protein
MCLFINPDDEKGRILIEVFDWDALTEDDLIGGFSISFQELFNNPADGWFRLLGPREAPYYNVPISYSADKLEDIKDRISRLNYL